MMDLTPPVVHDYIRGLLAGHDQPVLQEMEADADASGFPIVGRVVGVALELLARSIGARRVFELGSGYGYSAYWFSRAVGPEGELHLTDGDPENERKAFDYLGRAGLDGPVRYHVGDALESFRSVEGLFDVVFCDINKDQYPQAWEMAKDRIRVGGVYVCDNTIQAGPYNVATGDDTSGRGWADAVRSHNDAVAGDPRYLSVLLPVREGDLVALRLS